MSAPPFDSPAFKAATRAQWDKHAKGWNDRSGQISDWLRESTDAMLEMAEIGPVGTCSMSRRVRAIRRSTVPSASARPALCWRPTYLQPSWSSQNTMRSARVTLTLRHWPRMGKV